jgi:hypothetical protein
MSAAAPASPPPPAPAPAIAPWRAWLVAALAAAIVLGHAYEIVSQREHWPFSPYPMYSALRRTNRLLDVQVVGVTASAPPREISFDHTDALAPLPDVYLRSATQQAVVQAHRGDPRLRDAIAADVLKWYETRRRAGLFTGPPLAAVRIYELNWIVNPQASNASSPQRVLVSEARLTGAHQ